MSLIRSVRFMAAVFLALTFPIIFFAIAIFFVAMEQYAAALATALLYTISEPIVNAFLKTVRETWDAEDKP
jgi:hypothetical protein